jgi:hypothetical protein
MVDVHHQSPIETDKDLRRYDKLLAMAERESKALLASATKLRLTTQSRWQPVSAARRTARPPDTREKWDPIA